LRRRGKIKRENKKKKKKRRKMNWEKAIRKGSVLVVVDLNIYQEVVE